MEMSRSILNVLNEAVKVNLIEEMTLSKTDASGEEDSPQREELVLRGQWGLSE